MINDNDIIEKRKEEIRKEITRRLKGQEPSVKGERSLKIQKEVLASDEYTGSRTVMTYVPLPSEVDTRYLIGKAMEQGKRIAVPYVGYGDQRIIACEFTAFEDLEKGPFGIEQPREGQLKVIPLKEIGLIVVPAIAYDEQNMRLGRGGGFYDRFLASGELSASSTIGIAFSFQIVEHIPSAPHDRPVNRVVTD